MLKTKLREQLAEYKLPILWADVFSGGFYSVQSLFLVACAIRHRANPDRHFSQNSYADTVTFFHNCWS
jgi:hypothetical protein